MDYDGHFKTRDGHDFYERGWLPEGAARTHLVLIHGYGEHCSRYAQVGEALARAGIAVHTYDQRGFGHSPGKRAYIRDFDALLVDLDDYLEHVRPRFEDKAWFAMGHSMGGMVLTRYVQTRTIDARGLVFSSPFLGFNDDVPKVLIALASVLGKIAPWLPVGGVDNTGLSRDPKAVEAADNDPLCFHGKIRARTGQQFDVTIGRARADFAAITAPAYIIHGACDKIVPSAGSRMLHEGIGSEDKTLKVYDGGYHELWNDLDKDDAIAGIRDWILARA